MSHRPALVVAGIVFTIVAIIHALRLVYSWEIMVSGQMIPMWVSVAGLIVAGILALWMFIAARTN